MAEIIADWAGKERLFRLDFGGVLDLEEARGIAIGALFLRISKGEFYAKDVYETLRLGLVGGGLDKIEAKRLVSQHMDHKLTESAAVAGDLLISLMIGAEEGEKSEGEPQRIKFAEAVQLCRVFNMSPNDMRALTYADFIRMVEGYNATATGPKLQAPTDEEFREILAKYEPEALDG